MRKEREKFGRTSEGPWRISYEVPMVSTLEYLKPEASTSTATVDSFVFLSDSTAWPDDPGWSTTWTEEVQ